MAFFLWNLPGLVVLTTCGILIQEFIDPDNPPWYLAGLPAAAISLVFKAFYGFASKLDSLGVLLSLSSCLVAVLINNDAEISPNSSQWVFPVTLALGGIVTFVDSKRAKPFSEYGSPSKGWDSEDDETMKRIGIPLWVGALIFLVWLAVLVLVIVLVDVGKVDNVYLDIFETMYRIGSIVSAKKKTRCIVHCSLCCLLLCCHPLSLPLAVSHSLLARPFLPPLARRFSGAAKSSSRCFKTKWCPTG